MPRRNNADSGSRETSRSNHHQSQDSGNLDRPRHTQNNTRHSDDRGHDYKRGNGNQTHTNNDNGKPLHRDSQSQRNRSRNGGGGGRGQRNGAGAGGRRDESSEPSEDLDDRRSESDDASESDTKPAWMMDRSARSQMQPSVNHSKQPWLNPALAFFIKDGLHVINLRNENEEILGAGKKDKRGGNVAAPVARDELRTRAETQQSAAQPKEADRDKKGKDHATSTDAKRRSTPEPERATTSSAPSSSHNHTPAPSVLDLIKTAKTVPETSSGLTVSSSGNSSGSTMLSSAPPVARESFTVVAGTSSPTPEETAQSKKLSAKAQPWRPSSQQTSAPDLRQLASQLHVSASGHLDPTLVSGGNSAGNTWTATSPASGAGGKAYFVSSPPMVQVGSTVTQGPVLVPTVVETMLPPAFTAPATGTSVAPFADANAASRLPSLSPLPSLYSDNLWSVEGSGWGDVTQILKSSSVSKEKDTSQADAAILNAVSSMPQTPVLTPSKPSAPISADGPSVPAKPSSPPLKGATGAPLPPPATAPLPVAVQAASPMGLSTSPMKATAAAPATATIAYATAPMQGTTANAVQAATPQATYAYAYQPMATPQPAQAVQWVQPQSTAVYYVQAPAGQPAQQAMIYAYAQQPAAQYGYYYQPADQGGAAQATQVYWPATY